MAREQHDQIDDLRKQAFDMSPAAQFRLASFVAENVGYVLAPDPLHGIPAVDPALLRRVAELEAVLQDLLNLQYAKDQLRALDCGIGTATENAVWLCARAALPTTARCTDSSAHGGGS